MSVSDCELISLMMMSVSNCELIALMSVSNCEVTALVRDRRLVVLLSVGDVG